MSDAISRRKTVKHYHRAGDLHELTFSCYRRLPLLTSDDWRGRLGRYINEAANETQIPLVAFVFMPEHVHLLVDPLKTEPRLAFFLARVKQPFSKSIKETLDAIGSPLLKELTVQERPGKTCFRFWQEGPGYDRNIDNPRTLESVINYLHLNPVRRGLCQNAVDWKWSSARWYLSTPLQQQDPDLPTIHGLRWGSLDRNFA